MTYRINSGDIVQFNPKTCPVLKYTGDVVVAIDPSKTNMGVVIGTTGRSMIVYLELSGKGCDTTDYCLDLKKFFSTYLSKTTIHMVGIEQAIMKKGVDYYRSQMVLTEIRGALLGFFLETYRIKVMEVNNYAWKGAILPDGYRGHGEKGSKRWLAEKGLTGVTDDVTDAICIYMYLLTFVDAPPDLHCESAEDALTDYKLSILIDNVEIPEGTDVFDANPSVSLTGNIGYYINHTFKSFIIRTPITMLTYDVIYTSDCYFKHIPETDTVCMLVMRC